MQTYDYEGGNLVIMVESPLDTVVYSSDDKFIGVEDFGGPYRTAYYHNDFIPNDPDDPFEGYAGQFVPKTTLVFDVTGRGNLEGMVYNENADSFLGVEIKVEGSNLKTMSDSNHTPGNIKI